MARHRQRAKDRKQKLQRDNVPGSLDHASAEVEQAEAHIVSGADGVPADDLDDESIAAQAVESEHLGDGAGDVAEPPAARDRSGSRMLNFLRASWAELQRVQWPDRRQVGQATAVVLGFVVMAGAFLGLADVIAQRIVDFIL
ncbi:MAG TPA: preprotein translocase subunit SecE [Solirubrobacteraceae bacterium]|jgi:preprotein translocase subunit SecE|nr:preprotein translocase subunit SecE [Solirubrobacteraceae bacterium]